MKIGREHERRHRLASRREADAPVAHHPLLMLQRSAGNIVIAKLIARDRLATPEEVEKRFRARAATLVAPPMGF